MNNIYIISLIAIFILLIFIYLHLQKIKENFNSNSLSDILVSINKESYQKYIDEKNKISDPDFGYTILPGTDPRTLGFCPLGKYFTGDFKYNNEDVFTKCKNCFNCRGQPGYYFSGGCLGDKDSVCKFGRVKPDTFIQAHKTKSLLHDLLPLEHNHSYKNSNSQNYIEYKKRS